MTPGAAGSPLVLVGESPRIRQILRLIEKLGPSRSPVLLLGETGTGKELVAQALHNANPVGPFVPIDCSALVGPLMESELFGHTKGAFTGATGSTVGLIEMADGGTAFFDEIGELPLDLQVKLLRVLQEKEFRPVGSLNRHKSDFRVIAATNRELLKDVERGAFRRDLYYRMNVVTLRLPPLRDHKEDIPALTSLFLARYGNNHTLSQEALEAMLAYDWPGNVRELENAIQRMVAVNSGPLLTKEDLPSSIQNYLIARQLESLSRSTGALEQPASPESPADAGLPAGEVPVLSLTEMEKRAIRRALEHTKGDRVLAAHLLGIGRTTLYRKLKEYRLSD